MKASPLIPAILIAAATGLCLAMPAAATQKQPATNQMAASSTQPRQYTDCHRDVREHRINGVRIRHRHVGSNCAIRVVKQVN